MVFKLQKQALKIVWNNKLNYLVSYLIAKIFYLIPLGIFYIINFLLNQIFSVKVTSISSMFTLLPNMSSLTIITVVVTVYELGITNISSDWLNFKGVLFDRNIKHFNLFHRKSLCFNLGWVGIILCACTYGVLIVFSFLARIIFSYLDMTIPTFVSLITGIVLIITYYVITVFALSQTSKIYIDYQIHNKPISIQVAMKKSVKLMKHLKFKLFLLRFCFQLYTISVTALIILVFLFNNIFYIKVSL